MIRNLTIAVPSKGRIMEGVYAFFAEAGLPIVKPGGARDYGGKVRGVPGAEVLFMSSGEIASGLTAGSVHLGVTGEDLMRERSESLETIALIKPLKFGYADVVVAVPKAWVDVRTMADLVDVSGDFRARHHRPLRVATKYLSLTRRFFAENGLTDYRIVESSGATEGAPAAGLAELIVDITTTGATLAANNLKVLDDGVILKSQAQLAASLKAAWPRPARETLAHILGRVAARERASQTAIIRFQMKKSLASLLKSWKTQPEIRIAKGPPPEGEVHCPKDALYEVVQSLRRAGATALTVNSADYIFEDGNPLFEAFEKRLVAG